MEPQGLQPPAASGRRLGLGDLQLQRHLRRRLRVRPGESTDPDNVDQAEQFICDQKETLGFNVCKIENCVPFNSEPILDGCPAVNGDFNAGDFAQATASAIDPSVVHLGGDDIIDFSLVPETSVVTTTQSGSTLFFGSFVGTLAETEFESDGIFVNANHTL